MQMGSSLLPLFIVPLGWALYAGELESGQLNNTCLIDSEIVTGSIEAGVCVLLSSRILSWDDVKLTPFSSGLICYFFFGPTIFVLQVG